MTAAAAHHAVHRHHPPSRVDTVIALASYLLQPVRVVVDWAAGHPEAVILPTLAAIWWWAGFLDLAMLLAAAGAAVVAVVMRADAQRAIKQLRAQAEDDEPAAEAVSG